MSLTNAATGSIWQKKKANIPASSTVVVDSFSESSFEHLEYIMHFRNAARTKVKSLILSVNRTSSGTTDIIYGKQGSMNIKVNTNITTGTYEMEVQNVETFDITLSLARINLK